MPSKAAMARFQTRIISFFIACPRNQRANEW